MENLVRDHLGFEGVRKDVRIGTSDWNAENLSCDQVQYATIDAHASFEIGKKVRAWKDENKSMKLSRKRKRNKSMELSKKRKRN
ncbi:hypothetical protein MKW94_012940 [Papaver nudicaule]|uniref:3'-5' exonuclease domain-containing protein n=1 Tax=Papaver nudicaule TaxID=74823 RepID=A0AA41W1Y3_PAPNU|nr:hypothetical protein [Papaver nudicaule]